MSDKDDERDLDRTAWDLIRGEIVNNMTYQGTGSVFEYTIDSNTSELYGGQKMTYYAPFTKCDRIADYRTAWAHLEKQFN